MIHSLHSRPQLPSPLPRHDLLLLSAAQWLVPARDRADWLRSWQAELWYKSHAQNAHPAHPAPALSLGLIHDALWLRTESCSRALTGTPTLCLSLLASLLLLAAVPAIVVAGSLYAFALLAIHQAARLALESSFIVFVSLATAASSIEENIARPPQLRLKPRLFFFAKMLLILPLAWLVTNDLCYPVRSALPFTAEILQSLFFVLSSLLALRWNALDSALRCQHCLCSLAAPARVGRPSWNFLEWNGSQLLCRHGHGLLSVPEIETSWCQSSSWVPTA
jgi:hypothetical protein